MPRLILTGEGETFSFEVGRVFRIGRHPDNDLALKDSQVSRWHAELRREDDHHRLVDLDSLNGTYVNDQQVQNWRLRSGDMLRIGKQELTWLDDSAPEESASGSPFTPEDIVKPVKELELDHLTPSGGGTPAPEYARAPEHLYLLFRIARALNESGSLNECLQTTLDMALDALDAERGAILLVERGNLKLRIQRGLEELVEGETPISSTITSSVMEEGLSVVTTDARSDPRFDQGESVAGYNIRSVVCAPLWEGDRARGVLYLDNHAKSRAFTERDMDLVTAIGHQVALGIRHHEMIAQSQRDAVLRHQLERYHSPDMVNMLLQQPSDAQRHELMAQERSVTILFCDIVEFSQLARKFRPVETANLLSHFFDEMTGVIFKHKGSVNKFMGDAVMALWGAPFSHGRDETRAVRCAAEMLRALYRFLMKIDAEKWFKVRIGLNTGEVIAGNIGSTNMLEYTVIGEAVNTAARIQDLAQPNQILIGEATRQAIGPGYPTVDLGYVQLKGQGYPTKVFELLWKDISATEVEPLPTED